MNSSILLNGENDRRNRILDALIGKGSTVKIDGVPSSGAFVTSV